MLPRRKFYIIRHGESEMNALGNMAGGSLDTPLTELGRTQARDVHAALHVLEDKPQIIVHSDLSRARDTASILNAVLGVPMYEDSDIREHCVGLWEGRPYEEIRQKVRDGEDPPAGEKLSVFHERAGRGVRSAVARDDGPVLIVCHGGVMRGVAALYDLSASGFLNCHLHEFEPLEENSAFPWRVWQYDLENGGVIRRPSEVFARALADYAARARARTPVCGL